MVNSWFTDCIHFLFAALTNYHKLRCLKHKLIISRFSKTEVQVHGGSTGSSAQTFFHKVKIKVLQGLSSFLESGNESTSKFIWVVGQILFYGIVGQIPLFPCWLSARGHTYFRRPLSGPWLLPPLPQSSNKQHMKSFLCLESNFFCHIFSASSYRKFSAFKASHDYNRPTWIILSTFPVLRSITLITLANSFSLCSIVHIHKFRGLGHGYLWETILPTTLTIAVRIGQLILKIQTFGLPAQRFIFYSCNLRLSRAAVIYKVTE